MPVPPVGLALPVHPHQLEVQEFDSYERIVDLRAAGSFRVDHIPGAVSLPWSAPGDPPTTGADPAGLAVRAGEMHAGPAYAIEACVGSLAPGSAVLLVCDQGGAVSASLAGQLAERNLVVDVLPGGWSSYQRWVTAGIEVLARSLDWRWVRSAPGGASQAVADELRRQGQQVLKLDDLLAASLVPGLIRGPGASHGVSLDSALVDALRRFDPAEPVWVDEVVDVAGDPVFCKPIHDALLQAPAWRIEASPRVRAELLLAAFAGSGTSVSSALSRLRQALPHEVASSTGQLAGHALTDGEAVITVLRDTVDPLYQAIAPAGRSDREVSATLQTSTRADLERVAQSLIRAQIRP